MMKFLTKKCKRTEKQNLEPNLKRRHPSLSKIIIEGTMEGKNCKGRARLQYTKQIMEVMKCRTNEELKGRAERISEWTIATD